ncbi:gluconokinase [Gilvimarinus agarilyticus]|uniref:gluconokinase n=1 Tax=Gilvimarinus agarilyticus TaxID=679259 RepID=UPI0005A20DF9|nr:gluconokinase, GntK/IdnK-type [Gilvimarinus agarilyticus]
MPSAEQPVLLIVMGVSGTGKSSVAQALAEHYGYRYLDADDFHSDEAKALMAQGTPLTDALRAPWVRNIGAHLTQCAADGTNCTLAFSGLRHDHREQLRQLPFQRLFVFLAGRKDTIATRMNQRQDHFMPTSLLDSQLASLQSPSAEPDVIEVSIEPALAEVIDNCIDRIDQSLGKTDSR